jgi:CII-binding regulator of phage lambda lysogenization HflD
MKRQAHPIAIYSILVFLVFSLTSSFAAKAESAKSLNETMVSIGYTMEGLFPILFDKQEADKKQQQQLTDSVEKLIVLFDRSKPHINAKSPTYRISFDVIKTQLTHARSANKYKNFNYTKSILKDITSVCASCHTQDTKIRTLFPNIKRDAFGSDYEYAEFSYMTRNYKTAVEYLTKFLDANTEVDEAELLSIMKQMITIYIQIYYQPDDAIALLNRLNKYKHHTKFSKKTLEEWLAGIAELKKDKDSLKTIKNIDQLNIEVHKILGELSEPGSAQFPNKRERIARLWLRGALYHYLNSRPPREEVPIILYWLAIVDRSINFSVYYSLSDMYLKECVLKYTSHPYAQKCFDEYKENIILSYSGSRGTDIPEDIQNELNALQLRINGVPK